MLWILLGVALMYYAALFFGQRMILYPGVTLGPRGLGLPPAVETITVQHDQGQTHGLYLPGSNLPGTGADDRRPPPLVVFFHGNYELAEDNVGWMQPYTQRGLSVLIIEYRGYGSSDGKPTQANLTADASAMLQRLIDRGDADLSRTLFHGRSLGGGVAAALAAQQPPAALVLESTFRSVKSMALRFGAPPFLARDPYDTHALLKTYQGPVLILHGDADQVIPVSHARKNHAAASNSTLHVFPDKNHNDPWHPDFLDALDTFLDGLGWDLPNQP